MAEEGQRDVVSYTGEEDMTDKVLLFVILLESRVMIKIDCKVDGGLGGRRGENKSGYLGRNISRMRTSIP